MTEVEWATCFHPTSDLMDFMRHSVSERKRRIFACACCRRIEAMLPTALQSAVSAGETFADGEIAEVDLTFHRKAIALLLDEYGDGADYVNAVRWAIAEHVNGLTAASWAASAVAYSSSGRAWSPKYVAVLSVEQRNQLVMLREILGNPFRSITLDPSWLSPAVKQLAEVIYQERQFDRLPLLADALEDSGCSEQEVLKHLRSGGEHVRGCWCLDLVLGKE